MPRPTLAPMPSVFTHAARNIQALAEGYYKSRVNLDALDAALTAERNGVRDRKYDPAELPAFAGKPLLSTIIVGAMPAPPAPQVAYTAAQAAAATAAITHQTNTSRFQQASMHAMQMKFANKIRMIKDQRLPLNMEKQVLDDAKLEHLAELDREQKSQTDYLFSRWTTPYEQHLVDTGQYSAEQALRTTPIPNGIYEAQKKAIEAEFKRHKDAINESLNRLDANYKTANAEAFKESAIEYIYNTFVPPNGPVAMGAIQGDDVAEHERRRTVVMDWIQRSMLNLKTGEAQAGTPENESLSASNQDGTGKVNFNINHITKENVEKSATAIYMAWMLEPENANKTSITLTLTKPPHTADEIAKIRLLGATLKANHGIDVKLGGEEYDFTRTQKNEMKLINKTQRRVSDDALRQEMGTRSADIYSRLDAKSADVERLTLELERLTQRLKDMDASVPRPPDGYFESTFAAYTETAQSLGIAMREYSVLQNTLHTDARYTSANTSTEVKDQLVREQEKHIQIAYRCATASARYLVGNPPLPVAGVRAAPLIEEGAMDILNRIHPIAGRVAGTWDHNAAPVINNAFAEADAAGNNSARLFHHGDPAGLGGVPAANPGVHQRRIDMDAALAAPRHRFGP